MLRVLAVDDTDDVRKAMERVLTAEGYQVFLATSGEEALAIARETPLDVAVVDYGIPAPDGVEVLAALTNLQPSCLNILASGALDVDVVTAAVNRGEVLRVLPKPFDGRALSEVVRQVVEARRTLSTRLMASLSASDREERTFLEDSLTRGQLLLAIQPIVAAQDRRPVAYEGLLRTRHPRLGAPLAVLRAAERHGLIHRLGGRVMELAAERVVQLPPEAKLFVNLHPDELREPDLLRERAARLVPHAGRIVIEITERSSMLDVPRWEASVDLLTELGFALAVDDLGAGYSSLSVLAQVKPRYIKVDMSIVRGIDIDPHKRRLLELLCEFAKVIDAAVVAEGVETRAEAEAAIECGASLLQGYLFGRPSEP